MNTINPISNPDDIRKEAEDGKAQEKQNTETVGSNEQASNPEPNGFTGTVLQSVQPQQLTDSNDSNDSTPEVQTAQLPLSEPAPQPIGPIATATTSPSEPAPIYPEISQTPLLGMPTNISYGFEYRLPLSSYILSLLSGLTFYTLVVIPAISILALMSSFGASASLTASSTEGLFNFETLKTYGPLWSFLFLSVFLIIPRSWARWTAMGIAAGILLYGTYQLVTINDQSAGLVFQTARDTPPQMYALLFFGTLPYIIAPLATIPYLMTSKARRAYS